MSRRGLGRGRGSLPKEPEDEQPGGMGTNPVIRQEEQIDIVRRGISRGTRRQDQPQPVEVNQPSSRQPDLVRRVGPSPQNVETGFPGPEDGEDGAGFPGPEVVDILPHDITVESASGTGSDEANDYAYEEDLERMAAAAELPVQEVLAPQISFFDLDNENEEILLVVAAELPARVLQLQGPCRPDTLDVGRRSPSPAGSAASGTSSARSSTSARQQAIKDRVGIPNTQSESLPIFHDGLSDEEKRVTLEKIGRIIKRKIERGKGFCLISGPTGSGKSTVYVMALLKEQLIGLRETGNKIFVAEPRRVAAKGLFNRYCSTGKPLGLGKELFGLKMANTDVQYSKCFLALGTAGWLNTKLIHKPNEIYEFDCIVIDEVHELSKDTEMLMGTIMCLQYRHRLENGNTPTTSTRSQNVSQQFPKIVLISATMNAESLYNYFRPDNSRLWTSSKSRPELKEVSVELQTGINAMFEVKEMGLESIAHEMNLDVSLAMEIVLNEDRPAKLHDSIIALMFQVIEQIHTNPTYQEYRNGLFLMNVPGVPEIERVIDHYEKNRATFSTELLLLPFHGSLSLEELRAAQDSANRCHVSVTPILLATPIADSSLTLPNCSVVLDSYLIKHMKLHVETGINALTKYWSDRSVEIQRKGRTGRQRNGLYVKFYSEAPIFTTNPTEIERSSLLDVYVRVLKMSETNLGMRISGFVTKYFTQFMYSKADSEHINMAIQMLLNSGQVVKTVATNTRFPYDGNKLTPLGVLCAKLFFTPEMIKATLITVLLGCFESVAVIAANAGEKKAIFFKKGTKSLRNLHFRILWAVDIPSDHLALSNVFRAWSKSEHTLRSDNKNKRNIPTTNMYIPTDHFSNHVKDEDLTGCRTVTFPILDDNFAEIRKVFTEEGIGTRSNVLFAQAGVNEQERWMAMQKERQHSVAAVALMTPLHHHFYSKPLEKIDYNKYTNSCILNSVFLYPAPPPEADARQWGPQLMEFLAKPSNIYPDVRVDRENRFVIATFPPCHQRPWLGMIHPSVKDVLVKNQIEKDDGLPQIVYTNKPSVIEGNLGPTFLNSHSKDLISKWPLLGDKIKPADSTGFTKTTVFQILHFINPHNFGVQVYIPKGPFMDFSLEMHDRLQGMESRIQLDQVKFGTYVIFDKKETEITNFWGQKYRRGMIISELTQEQIQDFSPWQQDECLIYVELIDHGVTLEVTRRDLFYFHETHCNYGMADMFTRYPRQGYRVSLSTVQPNYLNACAWSSLERSLMHGKLHNRDAFKALIRMDIDFSSKIRRRIVCKDIFPQKTWESFVNWATITNRYALPLNGVWMDDQENRVASDIFCPRPYNSTVKDIYQERNKTLKDKDQVYGEERDPNLQVWAFNTMFSPMEITFRPVQARLHDYEMVIGASSVNAAPMDFRLASTTTSYDNYDPLIAVGTDLQVIELSNFKFMISNTTTLLNPSHNMESIIEMLSYPVVVVIVDKIVGAVGCKLFQKNALGDIKCVRIIEMIYLFTDQDIDDIQYLRYCINSKHLVLNARIDYPQFHQRMTGLFQRPRVLLNYPSLETIEISSEPPNGYVKENRFMTPALFYDQL